MPLLLLFGISCGSAVMAPYVQASERLGDSQRRRAGLAWQHASRFTTCAFGGLVRTNAATELIATADRLGSSYKSPAQTGSTNSKKAADSEEVFAADSEEVFAAALAIREWIGMCRRLKGWSDDKVDITDPLIIRSPAPRATHGRWSGRR
jgi:hypothetical protein